MQNIYELLEVLGYIGAVFIGLILGLTGGGGSILTVPILVYLMAFDPVVATAYSLFVVGVSSSFGAWRNIRKKMVSFSTAMAFAVPSLIAIFSTRKFLIPAIPEQILVIGDFLLTKDVAIMVFFACLMLFASISMIKGRQKNANVVTDHKIDIRYSFLAMLGAVTGLVTGIVGAGGGFIIVPILVIFGKIPIKKAVATSLFIVAINALIGFIGGMANLKVDWVFLLIFTALAVVGIFLGTYLNRFVDGNKLKKGFGFFVLAMAAFIVLKELGGMG